MIYFLFNTCVKNQKYADSVVGLDAFLMSTTGSYVSHVGMVIKHGGETYVLESGGNPDGDTEIGCSTWKVVFLSSP